MSDYENPFHKFFHQTLPSWHPNLTIKNTIPVFLVSGVLLLAIGIVIIFIFRNVHEVSVDYTYCYSKNNTQNKTCADIIGSSTLMTCYCEVNFTIDTDIAGPVFVYYALTRFYQNHRSYISSKDNKQLLGQLKPNVSVDCEPFAYYTKDGVRTPIAPCGAIANSMFNDQLDFEMRNGTKVPLIKKNITWPIMKMNKFRNPPGNLTDAFATFAKPKNWQKNIWELDLEDPSNNGFENEDFIVWMQPATLSSFKKIYRRVNHTNGYTDGLPKGEYVLKVNYSFPTAIFNGTKSLVIANTSIFGTSNYFLAIIYIFTGLICLVTTVVFYIVQNKYSEYTDD